MKIWKTTTRAAYAAIAIAIGAAPAFALDWQQAKGTKLFLGMNKHGYTDALEPLIRNSRR